MPRKKQHQRAAVPLPKGVHRVIARGREYLYYHANRGTSSAGVRIKLPKDPQSPEFWVALRKAQGDVVGDVVKTVGAVCDLYEVSPQFTGLPKGTCDQYRRSLAVTRKAWGTLPGCRAPRPRHVNGKCCPARDGSRSAACGP
jgi:hypothetical protein